MMKRTTIKAYERDAEEISRLAKAMEITQPDVVELLLQSARDKGRKAKPNKAVKEIRESIK